DRRQIDDRRPGQTVRPSRCIVHGTPSSMSGCHMVASFDMKTAARAYARLRLAERTSAEARRQCSDQAIVERISDSVIRGPSASGRWITRVALIRPTRLDWPYRSRGEDAMREVRPSFDDADAYERYMGQWSRAVGDKFLTWLEAPQHARWLDLGCGSGAFG